VNKKPKGVNVLSREGTLSPWLLDGTAVSCTPVGLHYGPHLGLQDVGEEVSGGSAAGTVTTHIPPTRVAGPFHLHLYKALSRSWD
jgi:hypothetical protein